MAVTYDAEEKSAGGAYVVELGAGRGVKRKVEAGREHRQGLGRVRLGPGAFVIRVRPTDVRGGEFLKLRNLSLTPVAQ